MKIKPAITIRKFPVFYTICAIASIVSCKPTLYFPDRVNAPGFNARHQASANISVKPQTSVALNDTTIKGTASCAVDVGYSFADNFAIIGSYRGLNDKNVKESNSVRRMGGVFNGRKTELALGYFNNNRPDRIFESYLGYGNGTIFRKGTVNVSNNFQADYNSYFIQTAYGFSSDYVRLTAGLKLMANHYYRLSSVNPDLKYQIGNNTDNNSSRDVTNRAFFFLTPFMNFEAGYKFIMFNVQGGATTQLGGYRFFASPVYATFGLTFRWEAMRKHF